MTGGQVHTGMIEQNTPKWKFMLMLFVCASSEQVSVTSLENSHLQAVINCIKSKMICHIL